MTKEKKQHIVQTLAKKLSQSHFYITDSQGLNVSLINKIRRSCHEKGIHYQVLKNTLLKKTLDSLANHTDYTPIKTQVAKGPSSIFITQQAASPAKIIQAFQRTNKQTKPILKGAVIDSELFVGSTHLDALSKLKSKEALISELLSLLQASFENLLATLQSAQHNLTGVMKTLSNR